MSTFAHTKLPDCSNDFLVIKEEGTNFCICCLDRNKTFLISLTCEHVDILERLIDISINVNDFFPPLICCECHTFLVNIKAFKDQVETNNYILNFKCIKDPVKSRRLSISEIGIIDTTLDDIDSTTEEINDTQSNSVKIEIEIKKEPYDEENSLEKESPFACHENTNNSELDMPELQLESKNWSNWQENICAHDFELDIPTNITIAKRHSPDLPIEQINRQAATEITPLQIATRKGSNGSKVSKYKGKIKLITLTEEEVLAERMQHRQRAAFVNLKYKCTLCILGFKNEKCFIDHLQNKHMEKDDGHTCSLCQAVFSKRAYYNHVARHYKRYVCESCGKIAYLLETIIGHYNKSHEVIERRTFACKHCGFTTESPKSYENHQRIRHKAKLMCPECYKEFTTSSGLNAHIMTIHSKTRLSYSCSVCDKKYQSRMGLKAHEEKEHNIDPSDVIHCALCDAYFTDKRLYEQHVSSSIKHLSPDGEIPQCDDCRLRVRAKDVMRTHIIKTHLKTGGEHCDICNKDFNGKWRLRVHVQKVHENKTPPRDKICDHCGQGFAMNAALQSHIRRHTDERPFACEHCSATFAQYAALYTHTKVLHEPV